jgi:SRSO17 transposase
MKTYTPNLDPAVLQCLRDYTALFANGLPQAKAARWTGVYLQGLLLDGERKSIEPLARRLALAAQGRRMSRVSEAHGHILQLR